MSSNERSSHGGSTPVYADGSLSHHGTYGAVQHLTEMGMKTSQETRWTRAEARSSELEVGFRLSEHTPARSLIGKACEVPLFHSPPFGQRNDLWDPEHDNRRSGAGTRSWGPGPVHLQKYEGTRNISIKGDTDGPSNPFTILSRAHLFPRALADSG